MGGENMPTGMIDTGTEQLLAEVRDGVALITLNWPAARNALATPSPGATPANSRPGVNPMSAPS